MTQEEFKLFADNYSSKDFEKLKVIWNGKYGSEFHDDNYDFRTQLAEYLTPYLHSTKLELIRDIYLEMGKTSKMTFGVYSNFHLLAQELLQRGGSEYLMDYLRGASHTMDTSLGSGRITLSKEKATILLKNFDQMKAATMNNEDYRLFNDIFRKRLEFYANK